DHLAAPVDGNGNVVIKESDPVSVCGAPNSVARRSRAAAGGTDDKQWRCCRGEIELPSSIAPVVSNHDARRRWIAVDGRDQFGETGAPDGGNDDGIPEIGHGRRTR